GVLITGTVTVPPGYSAEGIQSDVWVNEGWFYNVGTETDAGGNYVVAVPPSYDSRWAVSVRPYDTDLGFQWAQDFYLGDQTQWDFDLGPGGTISGQITDGGSPVAYAWVNADSKWMNEGAETDENGYYEITNLPPAFYQMRADQWPERQEAFYNGFSWDSNKPITLEEGGAIAGIDFELPETGLIEGIVYDMDGVTTIEGARIMAMNDNATWEAWSEPDGRFYMDVPAGEWKLVIHPADFENNVYGYYLDGGWSYTYRDATPLVVPPLSEGSVEVTMSIPQRATLSGTIHDHDTGFGVGGILVSTLTDDPAVGIQDSNNTCTDENGDYFINQIIPGQTTVFAVGTCGASEYGVVTATFTATSGIVHNLDLVVTAGPIPDRPFTIKTEHAGDMTPLSSGSSMGVYEADQILPALFAPLVQLDDLGEWYSELLTQVPTTANGGAAIVDGRLEVTYTLLPDLLWSDGHPLDSGDIRFAWEKMVQPRIFQDGSGPWAGAAWKIERVETPAQDTAVLVYKHSQVPPDYLGAIPYPMPEHILGGEHATDIQHFSDYAHNPVGNGPYVVVDYVPGSHLDLAANLLYHKRDVDDGYPRITTMRFLFQDDPFWAVTAGQADVGLYASDSLPGDFETYDLDVYASSAWRFWTLVPDTRLPFFADTDVRQALYHAMDRDSWADPYTFFVPGHSYLPPDHPLYGGTITTYDFDLALAASMLDAAGWVDSNLDGIRDKDGVEFSFDLVYNDGSESRMSLLTRYQEDLATIGVDANVIAVPWEELWDNVRYGRYDSYTMGWGFDSRYDPNAYDLFASRSIPTGYNKYQGSVFSGYWSDPTNDTLLEAARNELDGDTLRDLYAQQTALMSQELPNWTYGWSPQIDVATPILLNFRPNQMTPATWNMEQWYVPDNPHDVSVRKTLAPDSPAPQPGVTIIYQVDVQNSGYFTMENVTLMDELPGEVIYESATPAPSSIVDEKLYWDLGDIAGYQPHEPIFVSVTIPATVAHDTAITNKVQVWADQTDTNPANDAFEYQVMVRDDVDLAVNKSGVGQPAVGADYDYTINYYNWGGAPAENVVLTDTLPVEVILVDAVPAPDSQVGQTLTWLLPTLVGN
ncbi:MAG: hypothetical protein JRJ82_17580, partial [Deltaproteobacteria bacterium]|nr:hypothetical protein [Deltaproteobacteria bacterium]